MTSKRVFWGWVLCVLFATGAVRAGAQQRALGLTLLKTFMRTQNNSFPLQSSGTQAFLPTVVACPTTALNGCTLRIEVSGTFENVTFNEPVYIIVSDGPGLPGLDPDASISTCFSCGGMDSRTFQWMQRSVPAGTKATVTVQFAQPESTGEALDRIETIELFKN